MEVPVGAAPADDPPGKRCAEVAGVRVCWPPPGASAAGAAIVVGPRPVPGWPAPEAGWRCVGRGADRTCEDRALRAGPFVCSGQSCVQAQPRLPDDGEWECVDLDG